MFLKRKSGAISCLLVAVLAAAVTLGGCGQQKQQAGGAAQVKAMKAIQQDTPLTYEYAGQVKGKDEE